MVNILVKENDRLLTVADLNALPTFPIQNIIWVDLFCPDKDEKETVEEFFQVRMRTRQELEEIESSSRYFETEDFIIANSNFLIQKDEEYINEPVSFIFRGNTLISNRHHELKSFTDTIRKVDLFPRLIHTGPSVFLMLFETRIDMDADMIEGIARDIALISKRITLSKSMDEDLILKITRFQEAAMLIRENIVDKQRVISALLKSDFFPKESYEKLRIIIKDIGSLLDHTSFSFERLEYLQNTFLGLVNIEQNKIIKLFTVATVVLMPPTLIASIYGMNFHSIPELGWTFGYPLAIFLMILSSLSALYLFRKKKWL